MDCTLFWETVKNQSHPKHKIAHAAVQNIRNRQSEIDLQNKDVTSGELSTNSVKAVTEEGEMPEGAMTKSFLEKKYEKATAEAINKVKQDLATKNRG